MNEDKTLKIGTVKCKYGPNRDPKRQKGPYKDPVPIIGTLYVTVILRIAYLVRWERNTETETISDDNISHPPAYLASPPATSRGWTER